MLLSEVSCFVLCSYYRRFIAGFATIAKPLHRLTMKGQPFKWADDCEKAISTLKDKICGSHPLANQEFTKDFILDTDASDVGIGAVLSQTVDGI